MSEVKCEGELVVESNNTGKTYRFDPGYFYFEVVQRREKSMGKEVLYQAFTEIDDNTDSESYIIQVTLNVWEYPVGATNMKETEVDGGEVVEDIDYWIAPEY
jgi:hypothetical protein